MGTAVIYTTVNVMLWAMKLFRMKSLEIELYKYNN